jgi:hypothetical protein
MILRVLLFIFALATTSIAQAQTFGDRGARHGVLACQLLISNEKQPGCSTEFGVIPEGTSFIAYLNPIEMYGEHCLSETRFCWGGELTGSYLYHSCEELR